MKHAIGIIGYGGMASWHHENLKRVGRERYELLPGTRNILFFSSKKSDYSLQPLDLAFVAAYDVDPARLELARSRSLQTFDSLDDFLACDAFDIVLIATPNHVHREMAVAAMNHGKHVLCEKPASLTLAELDEMIEASRRNGVLFTVHQNRRLDKDFRIIASVLDSGQIGTPYVIESRVHGGRGIMHEWRGYKAYGGGILYDWGVHMIDQLLYLVPGKVTDVFCRMRTIKAAEVDDYFKAVLTFESGLIAQVEVGNYCLKALPRWYVNGDRGSVFINGWDCDGAIVQAKETRVEWVPEIIQTAAGPTRSMAPRPKDTVVERPLPSVETDWADFYRNLLAALDDGDELFIKPAEVRRVMSVLEACVKSSSTGQTIVVNA